MAAKLQERSITHERILALTGEWENINLLNFHAQNANQSLSASLNQMIARIQEVQLCLSRTFQSDDLLKNRILNAYEWVEACRLDRHKMAIILMAVGADFQTSISTVQEPVNHQEYQKQPFSPTDAGPKSMTLICGVKREIISLERNALYVNVSGAGQQTIDLKNEILH